MEVRALGNTAQSLLFASLLLTACRGQSLDLSSDPSLARLIPAVGRHFYIHEAVLFPLSASGSESQTLVRVQRILSLDSFPSSLVRNVSEFRNRQERRSLCVVLFLGRATALAFVKEVFDSPAVFSCTWLLLDPPSLSDVRLPVDAEIFVASFTRTSVVVSEVYRVVVEGAYRETEIIAWRPDTDVTTPLTESSLALRRSDLAGGVIRFLVVLEEPWAHRRDVTRFQGYIPDVADGLSAWANVSFRMEVQRDHQYGLSSTFGNWTGMIGEMMTSPEPIVGGPLSMTPERFGFIDFTHTLYNNRDIMVIRRPTNEHDADSWQRLMSPFRLPVWIAVLSCFLTCGTFLHVLSDSRRISDGLLKAAGVICGQAAPGCGDSGPLAATSRLLVLSLHFTAICLVASYTGQLTAYLGIRRVHIPFYGMEGLLRSETRQLGLLDGSSSHAYFDESADQISFDIYNKMVVGYQMPVSDEEGLRRVCQEKNYAYMIDEQCFRTIAKQSQCQFLEIPNVYLINKICLGASKNFPYKRIFNYWLLKFKKHGILSRLESKNWPSMEEADSEELVSVDIAVVAPLLVGLGVGMLASLLVFALELQYHRIRRARPEGGRPARPLSLRYNLNQFQG